MALLDLSQVTRTLVNLLDTHITASPVWTGTLNVTPEPPDALTGDNSLGLYLYHAAEDPHNKNMLPLGNNQPPIRYSPMPLNLYYLLCAHSDLQAPTNVYREQLIMGCALKAFHDYPIITDSTRIGLTDIMTTDLQGGENQLRLELHPIAPEEAVNYWTAGSSPLRFCAYYQVSIVLLEPEEPTSRAGRVLRYNVFAFPSQTPRIDSSSNDLIFTIPGETDPRGLSLRPAQAPVGGQVNFNGSSLAGDSTTLLLNNIRWPEPIAVDQVAWNVQAGMEKVTAVVQETATAGGEPIIPGVYTATIRVIRRRMTTEGISRDFEYFSNESPFTISPRIDNITAPTPAGEVTVTGYLFAHADLPADAVQVYVGETRLVVGTAGSLQPGEFAITEPPVTPTIELGLRLPAGLTPGQLLPFRLFINGAESPPNWIVAP